MKNNPWEKLIKHPTQELEIGGIRIIAHDGVFVPDSNLTHSTQLMLNHFPEVESKKVLDVGTGTGILSIRAIMNGSKSVVATDNSSVAIENARKNAGINDVKVRLIRTDLVDGITGAFDIVLANLPIDGSLWGIDQRELIERFINSIGRNIHAGSLIYLPWSSIKQEDVGFMEEMFDHHGFMFEVVADEKVLGESWYLYQLKSK